jgi:hypothetical protein
MSMKVVLFVGLLVLVFSGDVSLGIRYQARVNKGKRNTRSFKVISILHEN